MTRAELVTVARTWIDTPWRHQGRLKGVGVDCVGFLSEVGRECGVLSVEETANYQRRPDGKTLRAKLDRALILKPISDMRPGDVLLFNTVGAQPDHVGIVADYPAAHELGVIHAYLPARKVIEHRIDASWRRKIVCAFHIPGLE